MKNKESVKSEPKLKCQCENCSCEDCDCETCDCEICSIKPEKDDFFGGWGDVVGPVG